MAWVGNTIHLIGGPRTGFAAPKTASGDCGLPEGRWRPFRVLRCSLQPSLLGAPSVICESAIDLPKRNGGDAGERRRPRLDDRGLDASAARVFSLPNLAG